MLFPPQKQNFKVTFSPDNMGSTNIGIYGYKNEVEDIVEKWVLESDRRGEIIADEDYIITVSRNRNNETMDFVLTEDGKLIEGKH